MSPRQHKLEISFLLGAPTPVTQPPLSTSKVNMCCPHTVSPPPPLPPPPPPPPPPSCFARSPPPTCFPSPPLPLISPAPPSQKLGKRFKCPACDKTFSEHGNSNKHYRAVHLQSKPFQCTTCDSSFAFQDGLRRHQMRHMNIRPWECRECGYRFKQKSHLSRCVVSNSHSSLLSLTYIHQF
jgi:transcription elongation factor Elf1